MALDSVTLRHEKEFLTDMQNILTSSLLSI